ncbi:MAG: hypothetical protein EZS26_001168 [Candidatus Ordinivivax streblomastigis]|uniref:Uncharacterized protein n=1 Tax=Candidatus Ordinivivax streblomastigis TaxID=2540710 RepID=A0A5M8P2L9_9BACT|nr:MAG: hypothetical protein EZS26_001168 [Candidatus Ordinivivax streblomastigis]
MPRLYNNNMPRFYTTHRTASLLPHNNLLRNYLICNGYTNKIEAIFQSRYIHFFGNTINNPYPRTG